MFVKSLMLVSLLTLALLVGDQAAKARPVEAVTGLASGLPFGVVLTNPLQSFDSDNSGPPYDNPEDKPSASGYTFAVRSSSPYATNHTLTVTFPNGTDLSAASTDGSGYQMWDPTAQGFKSATSVIIDAISNPQSPTVILGFGNLLAPIPAANNITVRITESAGIFNPAIANDNLRLQVGINGSPDTAVATSDRYAVGTSITASPRRPGAPANFTVTFIAPQDLPAESGTITITFDAEFGLPINGFIAPSNVLIVSDKITNVVGSAQPNQAVSLIRSPVIDQGTGPEGNRQSVRIVVPDMDRSSGATGVQGVAAGATVSVTFDPSAGLRNPTLGSSRFQGNDPRKYNVRVRSSASVGQDSLANDRVAFLHVPREIVLNTNEAAEGVSVTVTGRGFKNGTTAVVFVDVNGDGMKQPTESELTAVTVSPDDSFTTSFVVNNSIKPGTAGNLIQAVDGRGNSACSFATGPGSEGLCSTETRLLSVKAGLQVSPAAGNIGTRLTVTLKN